MRILPVHQRCAALILGGLICTTMGAGAVAAGARSKISDDLASRLAEGDLSRTVDVIIQTEASAQDGLRARLKGHGAALGRDLSLIGGVVATVPLSQVDAIARDSGVIRISPDRAVAAAMDVAAQAAGADWRSGAAPQPGSPTGRGVGVAVIDSGIYSHEDLGGALAASVDFVDPTRRASGLADDPFGHGTHVAGIIAGRPLAGPSSDGGWFGGLAPGAHLVSLRVLDHRGIGKSSDVIAALDWCVTHRGAYGIRVVNLSLGQPVAESSADDPLDQAVERAWLAGLVVVTSAGNAGMLGSGYGVISSPGNDPLAISVGALDDRQTPDRRDDAAAVFSSRGPTRFDFTLKPDLVAPGTRIVSLRVPQSTLDRSLPEARVALNSVGPSRAFEPRYFEMSGSSMAAALVSAAAAVMLEVEPGLSPDDVKARLMRHAGRLPAQDIYARGAGAIDLAAALAATERAAASPSPGVSVTDADVSIDDTGMLWGDPSLWSLEDLYGDDALWDEDVAQTISLFDDACMTGQGLTWQHAVADGVIWQHAAAQGIIWQTLTSEGLTWQHLSGSGLTWQHSYGDGICPF